MIRFCLIMMFLLSGCVEKKITQDYNKNIEDLHSFSEVPGAKPVDPALLSQNVACHAASVNARDIDLIAFTELLSKIYGVNISYSGKAGIKISAMRQHSCLRDVLMDLTESYNIGFAKTSAGYTIYPPEPMTKIFKVSYHNLGRTASSKMTVSSSNARLGGSNANNDSNTTIETKTTDEFWDNLQKSLDILIGDTNAARYSDTDVGPFAVAAKDNTAGQEVTIYRESGVIAVRALPRALMKIEQFLAEININCLKQVIIEAKILEIQLKDEFQQGINWQMLNSQNPAIRFGSFSLPDTPQNMIAGGTGQNITNAAGLASITNANTANSVTALVRSSNFNGVMNMLSTQGKLSVLSSPRLAALNNQRAMIKLGQDEYFLTSVSNTVVANNNTANPNTLSNFNLEAFFSGIALDATPKILSSDEVILHIHPMITTTSQDQKTITVSGGQSVLPLPKIETRETDTIVRAFSGDIIIIGGLVQNKANLQESGSPFRKAGLLNRILSPFQSKYKSSVRTELVILLKPTIVDSLEASENFDRYIEAK